MSSIHDTQNEDTMRYDDSSDSSSSISQSIDASLKYQIPGERAEESSRCMNEMMNWFVQQTTPTDDETSGYFSFSESSTDDKDSAMQREDRPMVRLWKQKRVVPGFYGLVMYNDDVKSMEETFKRDAFDLESQNDTELKPQSHGTHRTESLTEAPNVATAFDTTGETTNLPVESASLGVNVIYERKHVYHRTNHEGDNHTRTSSKVKLPNSDWANKDRKQEGAQDSLARSHRHMHRLRKALGLGICGRNKRRDDCDGETRSSSIIKDMFSESVPNGNAEVDNADGYSRQSQMIWI